MFVFFSFFSPFLVIEGFCFSVCLFFCIFVYSLFKLIHLFLDIGSSISVLLRKFIH